MRILIAPDSFKENLSAIDIAQIIKRASDSVLVGTDVVALPMSDGGDGFVEVIQYYLELEEVNLHTFDSLMRSIQTSILYNKNTKTVYIESANTIGLHLLSAEEKNPIKTTSFGLGLCIKTALDLEVDTIYIGIGGSSTNDAGTGMLEALGVLFSDKENKRLKMCGGNLSAIDSIDLSELDSRVLKTKFVIACDVENPLFGRNGAAFTYAAQKGASGSQIELLDNGLIHFNERTKTKLGKELSEIVGGGAAGGLGACFSAYFNAELQSGFQIVADLVNLEDKIINSDLIISAEGKIDSQSVQGKLVGELANLAKLYDKKLIVLVGSVGEECAELYNYGVTSIFSIQTKPMTFQESLEQVKEILFFTVQNIFRLLT